MRIFAQGWSDRKDGPGHRRIYYLKGCNLRCRWCASPESIAAQPELLFYPERAVGETLDYLCPHGAIKERTLDRSVCSGCADRAGRQFRHSALEWAGRERTPEELEKEVLRLSAGWDDFGGVTFGGGEPTLQAPELLDCINRLKKHRIHTAIESNATTPEFPDVAREVDLAIADLKAGTPEIFHDCTGGELAKAITDIPGASAVLLGGVVVYTNEAKHRLLGVPEEILESKGAVSYEVAVELARRVRESMDSDLGVGITGLAGPDGDGVHEVGTVFISLGDGKTVYVREKHITGRSRSNVRLYSCQNALDMIRRYLNGLPVEEGRRDI